MSAQYLSGEPEVSRVGLMYVVVTRKKIEADDILSFELMSLDGARLPAFTAGAHIDLHVSTQVVRQYSLCNHPDERHRYLIAVLKERNSRGGSIAMHDSVREGDTLQISQPRNLFQLVPNARKSILFAGGIGITPIMCMAERLAEDGAEFQLHYCTRSRSRMAFRDRIHQSRFSDQTTLHFDDGPESQRLDVDSVLREADKSTHLYVCGPPGFMKHVLSVASRLNWPEACVHREYFSQASASSATEEGFAVQLASSGQVIQVAPGQTIAAALAASGVQVPLSCEQGVCGTCLTGVRAGVPLHRDSFMTEEEHARNDAITVCCSRSLSSMLVLDL